MGAGEAIYNRLTTDVAVSAIVDTRVFPSLSPEQKTFPLIVYSINSADEDGQYTQRVNPIQKVLKVVSVAETYSALENLAKKVRDSIDDQSGTWGGVVVQGIFFEDESDDVLAVGDDFAKRYYLKEQTYSMWYVE